MIDRIRQKRVSDEEIRAYFAVPSSGLEGFRELAVQFSKRQQGVALELIRLPLEHDFWAAARQSQKLQDSVVDFLTIGFERTQGTYPPCGPGSG